MNEHAITGAPLAWAWLGRAPYAPVARLLDELQAQVGAGADELLLFLEHDPVITLGRSADPANVLAARIPVERSARGGDVTVHGPGQLVIYPIVKLTRGVVAFVEAIGRAIAEEAAARGVRAAWQRSPAGVWVEDRKLAACGLRVRRRVASHGFALNVTDEILPLFDLIVPCGLSGVRATSLASEGASPPLLPALASALAPRIAAALERAPTPLPDLFLRETTNRLLRSQ